MECWNIGTLSIEGSYTFINLPVKSHFANKPLSHFPRTHYSIIPVFQHSNCERSELSSALAFLAAKYSVTVKIFFAIGIPGQLYVS